MQAGEEWCGVHDGGRGAWIPARVMSCLPARCAACDAVRRKRLKEQARERRARGAA